MCIPLCPLPSNFVDKNECVLYFLVSDCCFWAVYCWNSDCFYRQTNIRSCFCRMMHVSNWECVSRYVYRVTSNECIYFWHGFSGFHSDSCSNDIFIQFLHHELEVCSNILEAFHGWLSDWLNVVEMNAEVIGNHSQSPWRWRQYFLKKLWSRHLLHHVNGHKIYLSCYHIKIYFLL